MKRAKRIIQFSLVAVLSFFAFAQIVKQDVKLVADKDTPNSDVTKANTSNYEAYIEEKTALHNEKYQGVALTPKLEESIVIYGEDFDASKSTLYDELTNTPIVRKLEVDTKNGMYTDSDSYKDGKSALGLQDGGTIAYDVEVAKPGFYTIYLNYYTIEGYSSSIERSLKINGETPFASCESFTFSRVWQDKKEVKVKDNVTTTYNALVTNTSNNSSYEISKLWRNDTNGNELKPQQVEKYVRTGSYFKDSMGYVTEPFEFYFEQGKNTITIRYTKEPLVIDTIELREVEKSVSYEEYLSALKGKYGEVNLKGKQTRIEGEATAYKSSPTLYPITDRSDAATTPFSITKTLLNSIGGTNWKVLGDWISWEFEVPESGYYNVSMRTKQNMVRGMFSSRAVSVAKYDELGNLGEYETLFEELNNIQVSYNNDWKNVTLGDDTPYLFYFEKGITYSLKMEVTLGDYSSLIARLQDAIDELSAIYRRIIAYTTTSPDANRDYELTTRFADLFYGLDEEGNYTVSKQGEFYQVLAELTDISNTIKEISGGASDKTGVIDSVVVILKKFVEKPRTIPQRLNTYSTNVSSLGSLLNELREAPLTIDYLEIHTQDVTLPKAKASFLKSLWTSIASFFASFFIDYSSISETGDETNSDISVEVWMTLGRDQANVIRNLIDTKFTGETGYAVENYGKNINIDLKLTGADVLLKATLAGIGPDVALNVDSSLPVNYALRNAVLDLTTFDDFWDVIYAVPDGSIYDATYETNYTMTKSNVYMASSLRQFQFAAKETKDEWFDSESYSSRELQELITGIYALPEKQIFLMMFVRDDVMEELGLADMIPETWDDMIDLVAALQTKQLQFYLPVNDLGASALNPIFVSLLYQYGGSLYTNNNMESGLKSEEAMKSFTYWTELYTNYGFPTSASFVNRFRTGEMPIGISYYEMYNTLSVFAPELKGKWSFHMIPGTEKVDEANNTYIDHTATASGTGAVIMKQPALKDKVTRDAAWTFLKWWTNADTQAQFGREMEGILGSAARHATANVKALQSLAWPAEDLKMLMTQWAEVHEMPQIAGSYITGREMENAYRAVINNLLNPRETLYEYAKLIDNEIDRKRSEFNLPLKER